MSKRKKKNGCSKAVKVKDCSSEVPSSSITKNSQVEFYESTNKEKIPIKENTLVQLGSNENGYKDKQEGDAVVECNEERLGDGNKKIAQATTNNNNKKTLQPTTEQMAIIGIATIVEMPQDLATKKLSMDTEEITREGDISERKTGPLVMNFPFQSVRMMTVFCLYINNCQDNQQLKMQWPCHSVLIRTLSDL